MKKLLILVIPAFLGIVTCNPQFPIEPGAHVDFDPFDSPVTPLKGFVGDAMNGIYEVRQGQDKLGQSVVGKWVEQRWARRWSLYSLQDVVFTETAGGSSDSTIRFIGYVRNVRSGSSVGLNLQIQADEGARELLSGIVPSVIIVRGTTDDGVKIELRRVRGIGAPPFTILAHQGGGRNSDRLGYSENSIPMIRHAAIFGATGIEIDVRRTRDNKIIVFHDDTFSPRTVQGIYLLGPVENFDLQQIQSLGKLINGEPIPTLSDALDAVIDDTNLSWVWLDVKDPVEVDLVIPIQMRAMARAAAKGNDSLRILLGIPSQEVLKAYENSPLKDSSEVLTELDATVALSLNRCKAWARYWTENITQAEIDQMHSPGRDIKVFVWTVDLREEMIDFMGRVDGILTNYPSLARGLHDSKQ